MERVHSRESIPHKESSRASSSREKSPSSAVQRRESWRERSKSPGSRRASRSSRAGLESEDNNSVLLDQSSTGDPTKPLSPSLRRRRFHERKVPIARRSSSMSIGDPTDTYRAVRPFKSVDYAYGVDGGVDNRGEKKTIAVTDLDHAEVEMSKASQSTPNLSDLAAWTTTTPSSVKDSIVGYKETASGLTTAPPPIRTGMTPTTLINYATNGTIEESAAKIAAAVEDIDGVFNDDVAAAGKSTPAQSLPPSSLENDEPSSVEGDPLTVNSVRQLDRSPVNVIGTPQAEDELRSPTPTTKAALKSASASQVSAGKKGRMMRDHEISIDFQGELEKDEDEGGAVVRAKILIYPVPVLTTP